MAINNPKYRVYEIESTEGQGLGTLLGVLSLVADYTFQLPQSSAGLWDRRKVAVVEPGTHRIIFTGTTKHIKGNKIEIKT